MYTSETDRKRKSKKSIRETEKKGKKKGFKMKLRKCPFESFGEKKALNEKFIKISRKFCS